MIKLNLGCREVLLKDYINIDIKPINDTVIKMDVRKLDYPEGYADEILASHIIEHFHEREVLSIIKDWHKVLRPGGTLIIETPELLGLCKEFIYADSDMRKELYHDFFSCPWIDISEAHLFLHTEDGLRSILRDARFISITRTPVQRYPNRQTYQMRLEARKI